MKNRNIKFKPYDQDQMMLLPPSLSDMIDKNHPVRIVNEVINEINVDPLLKKYKKEGCPSYHPRMMLKVLVFGYLNNLFSSRRIESAVKENIYFMWLSGMEQPDHNTINRFRSERLKGVIKKVFCEVVQLLANSGHLDLQSIYTDGTKIEANANRYTFVWGKGIKTSRERISRQLEELWDYTQKVAAAELQDTTPTSFDKMNADEVRKTIEQIDEALKDKPVSKEIKQKIRYGKKNWPDKLMEYDEKEKILGDRNSYSKTDTDATFMRMKEDHMNNGQLKPGYNTQISTNNQLIANYTIHQNPTDTKTLKPHLASFEKEYGKLPDEITTDSGYGSEENYEFLAQNQVDAYVKYNYFHKEQREKEKAKPPFHVDNLFYNKEKNCYICPMGQTMDHLGDKKEKSEAGYEKTISMYQARNCHSCPVRGECHKGEQNRVISVSHRLNELKAKAREMLLSEEGIKHRKRRPVEVEAVFGMLKQNKGFRRFLLRGIEKVGIEFGLLAMAHNLSKMASRILMPKTCFKMQTY